jgi:hypothetical protein
MERTILLGEPLLPISLIPVGPSSEKRRRLKKAETKPKRSENPLHQRQIESGVGLIVTKSMPNKQPKRVTRELPNKFDKL